MVGDESRADAAKYGDARRSEIKVAERAVLTQTAADEPVTLILSQKGWLRARVGHNLDLAGLAFKDGDAVHSVLETRTVWPVIVLDNLGRAYTLNAADVPTGRGDGVPVTSLVDIQDGAKALHILSGVETVRYVMSSASGYGFIAAIGDMAGRVKAGKAFVTLDADDTLLTPLRLPGDIAQVDLLLVSAADNGRVLAFPASELRDMARGRGLQLMQLAAGEKLSALCLARGNKVLLATLSARGNVGKEKLLLDEYIGRRGKSGKLLPKKWNITAISDAS
jgi:topoisomerase-4 subunit A